MTDDRLHEIADWKTRPVVGDDETIRMAEELLALRAAVRRLAGYAGDFAADYPAIAEDIERAARAVADGRAE